MSTRKRPLLKKVQKKPKNKFSWRNFLLNCLRSKRGLFQLKPRTKFVCTATFDITLNNATVLVPFCYAYLNLSNPLKSDGGAATTVMYLTSVALNYRKFLIIAILAELFIASQEAYATVCNLSPCNFLPPNTVAQAQLSSAEIQTQTNMMSGVGSPNKIRLESFVDLVDFGGFDPKNSEDSHWGGLSPPADPVDNMYMHLSVDTNGAASVSGLFAHVKLHFLGIAAELNENN